MSKRRIMTQRVWTEFTIPEGGNVRDIAQTFQYPWYVDYNRNPLQLLNNIRDAQLKIGDAGSIVDKTRFASIYHGNGLYLPPRVGSKTIVILTDQDLFLRGDIITDVCLQEEYRITARNVWQDKSVFDRWNDINERMLLFNTMSQERTISDRRAKELIIEKWAPVPLFRPTWAKAILLEVMKLMSVNSAKGLNILDMSTGYGERMVAACLVLGMNYQGYDPDIRLKKGHDFMIEKLKKDASVTASVEYIPFENAKTVAESQDIIFFSPPLFQEVIYNNDPTQASSRYKNMDSWLSAFILPSLYKCWTALRYGGILIMNVHDLPIQSYEITEFINLFVEKFLPNSSWIGTIIVDATQQLPIWLWKKVDDPAKVVTWNEAKRRSMYELYRDRSSYVAKTVVLISNPLYQGYQLAVLKLVNELSIEKKIDNQILMDMILPIFPYLTQYYDETNMKLYIRNMIDMLYA